MSKIAIDIDSTLYPFETAARDEFMKLAVERDDKSLRRGAYVPWVEWRSPADATTLDDWLEVVDRVHQPKKISAQKPFPNAATVLQELHWQGYELVYLSQRTEDAHEATEQWLNDWGFPRPHAGLVCCEDKAPHLSDCQYLIDDRPKTLVEFVYDFTWRYSHGSNPEHQRVAFGLCYEYNRALTDVPNIYLAPGSWEGIRYYLVKTGVLKETAYA
jgi:5'(3')-deoxyribonucleotidase